MDATSLTPDLWQAARQIATALARTYAQRESDREDLVQEALIWWHRALTTRRLSHATVRDFYATTRTLMQRAMCTYYRRPRARGLREDPVLALSLPSGQAGAGSGLPHMPGRMDVAAQDELELETYYSALEAACGKDARQVAENLVAPCEPVLCRALVRQAANAARVRVTLKAVRVAFALPKPRFRRLLREIRTFTRSYVNAA